MKRARNVTGWLLLGLLGGAVAQGCGSSTNPKHNPSSGANSGTSGKDAGSMTVEPPANGGNGGESQYDPLCGIPDTNFCVPDFETNSLCLEGGSGGGSGRGAGARGGMGGGSATGGSGATSGAGPSTGGSVSSPAGAGGESGAEGSSEGGMSQGGVGAASGESAANGAQSGQGGETPGSAGQTPLGGAAGEIGTGGSLATSGRSGTSGQAAAGRAGGSALTASSSCQVIESPNHKGSPFAACRPAGTGAEGSPCFSGADCAPKFACVGDGPGQCRAYCCSGPEQCQTYTGTHCAVEPLVPDAKSTRVLDVPVCMPAVKCSLAEQYPCPPGLDCSCPDGSACVVVSDNGTTSCLPVSGLGVGEANDPCPCAWGFVCSQASNRCVKLCEVAAPAGKCDSGRCQASAALPAGWGTCVGVAARDAGAP